ncbi:MBL fold metallo-hydrolase [Actinoalloteichus hymeniacidonis]|uniref:Zn-dependent hydrolase of beta-lactamase fold n=1 Tax=Actinoalloteichus hymeniacidonis TaxID=340345 RepID=A0AAC9HTU8_9PSEU|nr:MBL fold metallo-hydrolase [Actinoalloteichus hymeniacidonis]AOS64385.1 putative Zn-dependent hydrolase of beta-lactamase fold [Actinoalloteichus hymeniacidonis]MBB5907547.1 L-ascorbate metabolism protein UlaG (beta-lactamase superfamily) [Actinoalloteichus hymeniacidonis]
MIKTTSARRPRQRSFADRVTARPPDLRDMLRLFFSGELRTAATSAEGVPVVRAGLPEIESNATGITWVGHAGYVVRMGGACVLVDPVWSTRIPGIARRLTPPGIDWREVPRVDAVLISHNHYDHLDAPTLRRLAKTTPMLVPAGLGGWFARRGFQAVDELDWWESTDVAGLRFEFVPSHHWSRRTLFDTCRSLWGGWVIEGPSGHRLYHAGDTGYGHWFAEIGSRHPDIDVAMLPIGAYSPQWLSQHAHLNPEEAVRAFGDLGARRLATMHWGTFALSSEPVCEPIERVRQAWNATGWDRSRLWDLAVGESRILRGDRPVGESRLSPGATPTDER